ncbi:CPBP family intramembrane metalloprotease [Bacillus sp. BGMRC 2118]|nr:CPBP family intramembrane metalloprotease [Bacillus sp. BGMRC 2118]
MSSKQEFSPKAFIFSSVSISVFCLLIILFMIYKGLFPIERFLSFSSPNHLLFVTFIGTLCAVLYGILAAKFTPISHVDETNQTYQSYPLVTIIGFTFFGAMFEELLLRGVIQNIAVFFLEKEWLAIIISTFIFTLFHPQYFSKPMMVVNVIIMGIIFGCIYAITQNLLVPFMTHFLVNLTTTILFKYNIITLKSSKSMV